MKTHNVTISQNLIDLLSFMTINSLPEDEYSRSLQQAEGMVDILADETANEAFVEFYDLINSRCDKSLPR